jgi:hypothetical protein
MTMPDTALTKALQRVRENGYVLLQDWPETSLPLGNLDWWKQAAPFGCPQMCVCTI